MAKASQRKLNRKRAGAAAGSADGDSERYFADLRAAQVRRPSYTTRTQTSAALSFLAAKEPLPTADSRRSAPEAEESEHE